MNIAATIDASLVRRLVAEQFPQFSHLPIRRVEPGGWDNRTFRLGGHLGVRLPSAAVYAPQVAKEVRWLPEIAQAVELTTPEIVGVGVPGAGYPFAWTLRRWIVGTPLGSSAIADRTTVAADLARFLCELQRFDTPGPGPGPHSAGRGAPLRQWNEQVRSAISSLASRIDARGALRLWEEASHACPLSVGARWFHGDVSPGNLLTAEGRLKAVIDFGLAGFGDPACDLAIAWTWFGDREREVFRSVLGVGEDTWIRGLGWALWKALISLDDPHHAAESARVLDVLGLLRDCGGETR